MPYSARVVKSFEITGVDFKSTTPVTIIPAQTGKKFIPLSCHVICDSVSGTPGACTGQVIGDMNGDAAAIVAGGGAQLPVGVAARAVFTIQSASGAFWVVDLNTNPMQFDVETVSGATSHTGRVVLEGILY